MSTAPFSIKSSVVFLASELGLAAFVTYFQQEWYVFAGLSVLLFIGLLLYNYKRRVEPWHLILTGLIGVVIFSSTALAGVIWLRYWRPNTTVLEFSEQVYVQPKDAIHVYETCERCRAGRWVFFGWGTLADYERDRLAGQQ
jgi:hypothetical protein